MLTEFITWTANPALYDGFIEIRWYGLFFAIGFIVGYNMMERMFRHEQVNLKWLDSLFIYVVIATVLGARLGHCLFYAWDYYSQHPLEILKVWEGGLASHGGAIGIIIAIWLYSRRVTHRNMLWTFDRLVVPVALVAALIRTGNLMNHEIYGHVTTLPWGFRFIQNLSEWMKGAAPIFTEPSHPTQIYEALCYLLLFGGTGGSYFRDLFDRHISTSFLYRVYQEQSRGVRGDYVVEYGAVVEYSVRYRRGVVGYSCFVSTESAD